MKDKFDVFWELYPKKKSKGYARKAFAKLNPDDDLFEKMIEAVGRGKNSREWSRYQFIPYPSSFINGEMWEDQFEPLVSMPRWLENEV